MYFKIILLYLTLLCFNFGESAKILFLIPLTTGSETHFYFPIIERLASEGHEILAVSSVKGHIDGGNVKFISPVTVDEVFGNYGNISATRDTNILDHLFLDTNIFIPHIEKVFSDNEFNELVIKGKFDLIFTNFLPCQAFYGLIYKLKAPFITMLTFPIENSILADIGMYMPPSFVPHPLINFTNKMNFWQRLINVIANWSVFIQHKFFIIPRYEKLYRKYLGNDLPGIDEIQKNMSLVLMNTHFTSTYHRPLLPDIIEVGGIHCKEPQPLTKDLNDFTSNSTSPNGFIYISFGSVLKGESFTKEMQQKFLRVLSKLKQNVIWKWESEYMDNLPENILLKKWLPQQDILGHPNIKLFVSHAGLLSTQQAIYHGVPVLHFPLVFDQHTNAEYAQQNGYGIALNIHEFTEEELESAMSNLISNPKYMSKAKEMSEIFKDQMNDPLSRVSFWTKHVLKFHGAPHLRSSARELSVIQIQNWDVLVFIIVSALTLTAIVTKLFKMLLQTLIVSTTDNKKLKQH